MPHSQKGERHCLQRIYQAARKEEAVAQSAAWNAAARKKITAKKFAIPPQICSTPPGRVDVAKIHSMPPQSCPMPPESSRLIPEVLQCHPKSTSSALTPHFMAFEDTHSGHLFYQSEMPIVPYRSLSQDVPIYEKSTLHRCKVLFGAENGTRTRDLNLGKVALYQLSYFRNITPYLAVGITKVRSFF